MSWLKENRFLAGLVAATIVAGSALVSLMMQSMAQYREVLDAYAQAVEKLHVLQSRSPFPNAENLEKSRMLLDQYKSELQSLRAQVATKQVPANSDIQPQKFQDDLRAAVNQIAERASAAGVELPKGFYLGFSQYANSLPNAHVAPTLALQLRIIERIVSDLIDLKVQSIDGLNRLSLPEESSAAPTPQKAEEPQRRARQPEAKPSVVKSLPFDLAFTAEQGKLRVAFNSLLDSDQFLIVRNLALQNTARLGPAVARQSGAGTAPPRPPADRQAAPPEQSASGGAAGQGAPAGELNVILGRELVKASMRIEIIDFSTPPEPKK
ncbi:MAG TPA: Amuc_1100 family pilus-like protein [Terrimicrobiaceae bacterium]